MKNQIFSILVLSVLGLLFSSCETPLQEEIPVKKGEVDLRSANPASKSTVVHREVISETVFNPCTGENVVISGNFHTVIHLAFDNNGVLHASSQAGFYNTRGVGESSGIRYRLVGTGSDCQESPCLGDRNLVIRCGPPETCPGGAVVFNGLISQRLIAQGKAEDLHITLRAHITINANGDIVRWEGTGIMIDCK